MSETSIEFTPEEIEILQDCVEYRKKLEHRCGGNETVFNSISDKIKEKVRELNLTPSSLKQGIAIYGQAEIRKNEDGIKYLSIYGLEPDFALGGCISFKGEWPDDDDFKSLKKLVDGDYLPIKQAPLDKTIDILIYTQGIKLDNGDVKAKLPVLMKGDEWVLFNETAQRCMKINFYDRNDVID